MGFLNIPKNMQRASLSLLVLSIILIGSVISFATINEHIDADGQKHYSLQFDNSFAQNVPEGYMSIEQWANRKDESIPRQEWENLQYWDNFEKLDQFRHSLIEHPELLNDLFMGDNWSAINQLSKQNVEGFDMKNYADTHTDLNIGKRESKDKIEQPTEQVNQNIESKQEGKQADQYNTNYNQPEQNLDQTPQQPEYFHPIPKVETPDTQQNEQSEIDSQNQNQKNVDEQKFLNTPVENNQSQQIQENHNDISEEDKSWIDIAKDKFRQWNETYLGGNELPEYYFWNQSYYDKFNQDLPQDKYNEFYQNYLNAPQKEGFLAKTKDFIINAKDKITDWAGMVSNYTIDKYHNITGSSENSELENQNTQMNDIQNQIQDQNQVNNDNQLRGGDKTIYQKLPNQ